MKYMVYPYFTNVTDLTQSHTDINTDLCSLSPSYAFHLEGIKDNKINTLSKSNLTFAFIGKAA